VRIVRGLGVEKDLLKKGGIPVKSRTKKTNVARRHGRIVFFKKRLRRELTKSHDGLQQQSSQKKQWTISTPPTICKNCKCTISLYWKLIRGGPRDDGMNGQKPTFNTPS